MRVNRQIRAASVRLIDKGGAQLGVVPIQKAMSMAEQANLDLVEISPNAKPPVCKIIDYGKFRYDQAKREKEQKKAQHQVKVKEVKVKPNTDTHDLEFKLKNARTFIADGNKVKLTCMFRGREMAHPEVGRRVIEKMMEGLSDVATPEGFPKQMGRSLSVTMSPGVKKSGKNRLKENLSESKNEAKQGDESSV